MRSLFQAICNNTGGGGVSPVWMFGLYTNDKINVVIFRNIFSRTIPTMLNIMLHFWNVIVCYWTLPCNTRLPNCRQLQRLVACHLLFKEPRIHAICTFPFHRPLILDSNLAMKLKLVFVKSRLAQLLIKYKYFLCTSSLQHISKSEVFVSNF